MTIQRMDHVGIVVDDLAAATAFFVELGLKLQGEGSVEGGWVDRVVGLEGRAGIGLSHAEGNIDPDILDVHAARARLRRSAAARRSESASGALGRRRRLEVAARRDARVGAEGGDERAGCAVADAGRDETDGAPLRQLKEGGL